VETTIKQPKRLPDESPLTTSRPPPPNCGRNEIRHEMSLEKKPNHGRGKNDNRDHVRDKPLPRP
jgi:hypothetical protein